MGKFKNGKATAKDEITRRNDKRWRWTWRIRNIAFESGVVPENWRAAVLVPLYQGKGERTECKNYRGISLLSVVGKIYGGLSR